MSPKPKTIKFGPNWPMTFDGNRNLEIYSPFKTASNFERKTIICFQKYLTKLPFSVLTSNLHSNVAIVLEIPPFP